MKKKLLLLICMIFVCMNLTGCQLIERAKAAANNMMTGFKTDGIASEIANDNMFAMSGATKEKQNKLLKASEDASYIASANEKIHDFNIPFISGIPLAGGWLNETIMSPITSVSDALTKRSAAKLDKAQTSYANAKASDTTFLKSKEKAEEQDKASFKSKMIPIIIGVVILLAFGLIFLFLKKKKPEEHAAPAPAQPAVVDATMVGRDDTKSIENCKKYCKKFDIDYEESLAKYGGGDPKKLLDVLISSSKEDFHPKG